jgi:hypothetical protein
VTTFKIIPDTTQSVNVKVTSNQQSSNIAITGFGGPQGDQGIQGIQGIQGVQGPSGVVNVTSPITNSGTDSAATLGLDQTAITIAESQVTNLVSDLASKETPAGAQTKANTAQANAISTASTDATTKANAAQANAKTYADAHLNLIHLPV